MPLRKQHIVTYECEHCGAAHTRTAGVTNDGMCSRCGAPMRIEDLFSDRRFATLPVDVERRTEPPDKRAA